jgi:GGDEF domain-containing protein
MERIAEAEAQVATRLQVELSMSAGVAYYPADGISADELMNTADRRMYAQKREKRSSED